MVVMPGTSALHRVLCLVHLHTVCYCFFSIHCLSSVSLSCYNHAFAYLGINLRNFLEKDNTITIFFDLITFLVESQQRLSTSTLFRKRQRKRYSATALQFFLLVNLWTKILNIYINIFIYIFNFLTSVCIVLKKTVAL